MSNSANDDVKDQRSKFEWGPGDISDIRNPEDADYHDDDDDYLEVED